LVLLTAAGPWADDAIRACLADGVRWPVVFQAARGYAATSEVWRRLERIGEEAVDVPVSGGSASVSGWPPDPDVAAAFRRTARIMDFRMSVLQERLDAILERLDAEGLPVVLLKGAATGLQRFGGLHRRPMGDVDLLLAPEDARVAHVLARDMGWNLPPAASGLRPHMYEGLHHHIPLVPADGLGFALEIHHDLFPEWGPFGLTGEAVMARARPLEPAASGAPLVPAPEDHLLHTCLHFAWSHSFRFGAWRTFRDLDGLLDDPQLDLEVFCRRTLDAKGATCVFWVLTVFGHLMGRPLPHGIQEALGVRPGGLRRRVLLRHLGAEAVRSHSGSGVQRLRRILWTLAVDPVGSGHGSSRPWAGDDRWPGPTREALTRPEHQPSNLGQRTLGLLGYLGFLAGGLIRDGGGVR